MTGIRYARLGSMEVSAVEAVGQRFEKHSHDECVISANLLGEEQVWLDRKTFTARAGAITAYNPGQIQAGGAQEGQPWRFVSLYLTTERLAADIGVSRVEFERPVCERPDLAKALAVAIAWSLSGDPFMCERGEEELVMLLPQVMTAIGVRLACPVSMGVSAVIRTQELLAARLQESPTLDEIACELGLSKFHMLRTFQQETGLSPRQWAMQLRTRRAQALLRAGMPATQVAYALGFADQSHLSRHFRAAYGLSPGRYQRALRG
ncbi:AraC family chemosensory pili system transcriptional regulator ChpD [Pseudomonas duriflava]|uniref:AraC family chemosensory pili system transcriptional regulator ChpD n=1 Tax=Pseudomonas duriflava TaxID=459528 RepID=A0A562QFM4_9PSED|nr:AraC family transcriptional regulator [Pseudomonas duriflava]TWI54970.1 AraC family chemosensory pili system transcriptional regulator ChpD [Pseudomonas duriflava]